MNEAATGFFARVTQDIPSPFEHQTTTTQFILDKKRCYVGSDPGTGKTRSCLDAISEIGGGALVLAPKAILEPAWCNDARLFTPHLTIVPCYAERRAESFRRSADIHVTNHDAVAWLADNPWAHKDKRILIVDEATAYKNKDAKRSRAALKVARDFEYVILMCGTPMPQGLEDLWHQFLILDGGERLGKSFYAFRNATHSPDATPFGITHWVEKEGAREVVADLISDAFVRFELEQCIDMPERVERTIKYTLPAKQQQAYDRMVAEAILEIDDSSITAVNAAALLNKLLQLASGAAYDLDSKPVLVDPGRAQLIAQLCAERDHSLVAFQWTHQRDQIVDALKALGITNIAVVDGSFTGNMQDLVNDFQAGKYRVLLAHPKSASHGLTLTKATTTIWASPTYELERFAQFNRRTYRAGQKQRTEFLFIEAEGTVDSRAYARLFEKAEAQEDLITLLKSLR
jgi:SNF2 family DNA or RNA helicase